MTSDNPASLATQGKDPLLVAGRILTFLLMGLTGLVVFILLGMIPVLLFNQGEFTELVAESGASFSMALSVAILALLLAAALTAMAFHFFQLLGRIIDTVEGGEPFTPVNADRMSRMGWITLGFHALAVPLVFMVVYLGDALPSENLRVDYEFSLTGLLLAIVLFILARVFRHGAAMRDDLEGTV